MEAAYQHHGAIRPEPRHQQRRDSVCDQRPQGGQEPRARSHEEEPAQEQVRHGQAQPLRQGCRGDARQGGGGVLRGQGEENRRRPRQGWHRLLRGHEEGVQLRGRALRRFRLLAQGQARGGGLITVGNSKSILGKATIVEIYRSARKFTRHSPRRSTKRSR